ncbi:MAG: hypothetical protein HFJ12_01425 [Bacilli bacterium]|nr:hypothetical protein [Bacilli bacterium]
MKTITHICDLCKQSKGENELAHLEARSRGLGLFDSYRTLEIDICKSCLEKKGFIVNRKEEQSTKEIQDANSKNLENKIIDILDDLGVQFYE